jgi:hypothetical protein
MCGAFLYRGGRTRTCNPRFWRSEDEGLMAQLSGSRLAQFTLGHGRSALVGRSWATSWGAGICLPLGLVSAATSAWSSVPIASERVRRIQATTGARPAPTEPAF